MHSEHNINNCIGINKHLQRLMLKNCSLLVDIFTDAFTNVNKYNFIEMCFFFNISILINIVDLYLYWEWRQCTVSTTSNIILWETFSMKSGKASVASFYRLGFVWRAFKIDINYIIWHSQIMLVNNTLRSSSMRTDPFRNLHYEFFYLGTGIFKLSLHISCHLLKDCL